MRNESGLGASRPATIGGMRELSDDFKLSFRSIPEVYEAFGAMVARTATDPTIRFAGTKTQREKKAHRAALLNALILHLAELPQAEQRRAIARGMDLLNATLRGEPPPPIAPAGAGGIARAGRAARAVGSYRVRTASEREADDPKPPAPKRARRAQRPE
jgi:hypothetical protein